MENEKMQDRQPYQVYLSCLEKDENGQRTRDFLLARQLCKRLTEKGITVFFHRAQAADEEARQAAREAVILIMAGCSVPNLASSTVRGDYDAFIQAVYSEQKQKWRIATYLLDLEKEQLPEGLQQYRSFSRFEIYELVGWVQEQLAREAPKQCIADTEEDAAAVLPDAAESDNSLPSSDEIFGAQTYLPANGGLSRARRAADMEEISLEEAPMPSPTPAPMPSLPSLPNKPGKQRQVPPVTVPIAQVVKPAKINKVDFSVIAPQQVKPGGDSLVDVFMYTKSQRKIVDRAIKAAKEQVTEAARTGSSVSVRQGSSVTVVLSSRDALVEEDSETLIWNGDALDFQFRFSLPDTYEKKLVNFACEVLFDGIHITRLYFSVPVNTAKRVPVRFVRKDSRRAFVSYSSKDRARVVEQLYAIQSVAPKLRFWMDSQSMTAGDQWRPAILIAIQKADVFLLFWSQKSKASDEVRKEWEYALALEQGNAKRSKNGSRFISPVPLESPKDCPPPAELNDLQFGDPSFDGAIDHIQDVQFVSDKPKAKNIRLIGK